MEEEKLEAICFNCNQFFPTSFNEPTEFGICLSDPAFDPFIDELLEDPDAAPCQELINSKKFTGEQEACDDFEELEEGAPVDDDSPLGVAISRLVETGEFNVDSFRQALFEEQINNIDFKSLPVDKYLAPLYGSDPQGRQAAISSLGALAVQDNVEAFNELFKFFKKLPPPTTIEEVHFKIDLLRYLDRPNTETALIHELIDELNQTVSNNTTRQWITAIFKILESCPREKVREPLENMLSDKSVSYRLKQKMKNILDF